MIEIVAPVARATPRNNCQNLLRDGSSGQARGRHPGWIWRRNSPQSRHGRAQAKRRTSVSEQAPGLDPGHPRQASAGMIFQTVPTRCHGLIQPHPRASGISYEFPKTNGYPLFWIKKIKISSTSNAQADYGDFKGLVSDITSNQRQIGRPTTLDIKGDFKSKNVTGITVYAELNNTKTDAVIKFSFGVGSYILENLELLKSPDGQISIPRSNTSMLASGEVIGFKNYDMKLKNEFKNVNFQVATADKTVNEILSQTLSAVNQFDLEASAKGTLADLDININSSLGADLQRSFENLLKNKIAEANDKLQKSINQEIGKLKAQLDGQTQAIKNQVQTEVNKVQAQLNDQKKMAEQKVDAAKKDGENQVKGKLQQEGQKALDDLKKGFGF